MLRLTFVRGLMIVALVFLPASLAGQDPPAPKRVAIDITEKGFSPSKVEVQAKKPVTLVFTRKTDKTCATEVAVPSLKIKKALPLNEAVPIDLTPEKGEIAFVCGMNMLKGTVVVK